MTEKTTLEERAADADAAADSGITGFGALKHKVRLFFLLLRVQIKMWIRNALDINVEMQQMRDVILGSVGQEQKQRIDNDMVVVKLLQQQTVQVNRMAKVLKICEDAVLRLQFYEKHVLPLENAHRRYKKEERDRKLEESRKAGAEKAKGNGHVEGITGDRTDNGEVSPAVRMEIVKDIIANDEASASFGQAEMEIKSQVRLNAEKDPNYAPYCMNPIHSSNVRMEPVFIEGKKEPFLWACKCGAEHDERTPQPPEPRQGPVIP